MFKPNNSKKEPAPGETKPVSEEKPNVEKPAEEAEALCAELERFFRVHFGDIPSAADLGQLRSQQAGIRNLVQRALAQGGGANENLLALEKERDKFKDAATRVHADFLNYQARAKKDLQRAEEQALRSYVFDLLPILDSLDLSVRDAAGEKAGVERLREALQLINTSLSQTLAVHGLERIAALGKPFDPNIHEASAKRPANPAKGEKPNQVVEELRPGYLWKGLLLRPVQVLVSE